MYNDNEQLGI